MDETTLAALWARHAKEEEALLRSVLEPHGWFTRRAAAALGIPEASLRKLIGRHPELAKDAKKAKRAAGYRGGRPKADDETGT